MACCKRTEPSVSSEVDELGESGVSTPVGSGDEASKSSESSESSESYGMTESRYANRLSKPSGLRVSRESTKSSESSGVRRLQCIDQTM